MWKINLISGAILFTGHFFEDILVSSVPAEAGLAIHVCGWRGDRHQAGCYLALWSTGSLSVKKSLVTIKTECLAEN